MEEYTESNEGFTINGDKITMEEMENIKFDENTLVPPTSNVKLRIRKAEVRGNGRDGAPDTQKTLNILWQVVDGIDVNGEIKYQNATFFQNGSFFDKIIVWADTNVHSSAFWTERRYLKNLKDLMKATGLTTFDPDNVEKDLVDKVISGAIKQVAVEAPKKNENGEAILNSEGKKVYAPTGDHTNAVEKMKPVVTEAATATQI